MKELWDMFLTFARIGGLTFGGGYAMLPMLQREVVEKHGWATEEELADYYAIGQCTPGVIAVNTATFIGYRNDRRYFCNNGCCVSVDRDYYGDCCIFNKLCRSESDPVCI